METKHKEGFDVFAWLQEVRDEHHRKWGHLPMEEFMQKLSEEAEQSEVAGRFRKQRFDAEHGTDARV